MSRINSILMPCTLCKSLSVYRNATSRSQNRCSFIVVPAILKRCNGAIGQSGPTNKSEASSRSLRGPAYRGGVRERTSEKREKVGQFWRTPEITLRETPRYYARKFTPYMKDIRAGPVRDQEIYAAYYTTLS